MRPTHIGHTIMKKAIVLAIAAVMTLSASVTVLAGASTSIAAKAHGHDDSSAGVTAGGNGSCRHGGCKCAYYVRAVGGAGKCVCGHWDYVHN